MNSLRTAAALAALLLATGCGQVQGRSDFATAPPAPTQSERLIARLEGVSLALQPAPTRHLPLLSAALTSRSQQLSLSDLQADFETMFYPINPSYGLTATSPGGVQNANFIRSQALTGNFDITRRQIVNNPLNVTGVLFEPIRYSTQLEIGRVNETFNLSGCLLLPEGIDRSQLKGVVLYYHGTVWDKSRVGSNPANGETQLAAALLASQGYVVVIPDGVGLGDDWQRIHPYLLYPRASARVGLALVNEVKSRIEQKYQIQPQNPALKLFSMGYSEGALYALSLAEYLRSHPADLDPRYHLTHTLGLEGIYSLADVTHTYLFTDVGAPPIDNRYMTSQLGPINFSKPLMVASLYFTYGVYGLGGQSATLSQLFQQDFYNMHPAPSTWNSLCLINGREMNILEAFTLQATDVSRQVAVAASGAGTIRIPGGIPNTGGPPPLGPQNYYPFFQEYLVTDINSAVFLVLNDIRNFLLQFELDLANLPDRSISLITLQRDSIVLPENCDSLVSRYPGKINTTIRIDGSQLSVPDPLTSDPGHPEFVAADHPEAVIYEFIYALQILNGF